MNQFITGFIIASVIFISASIFMVIGVVNSFQKAAIGHGAASWVCDPMTGETVFKWNKPEAKP